MRFAHIADTHIRNLKYHFEYREVFQQLYKSLQEEKVDYIIHCGDIAHTKTQISPEFVDMCREFFENLASIAPTYIILGNHDGNLRNGSRQDALSPIAKAINNPNLILLKDAGETKINDKFCLNVLSVFDEESWVSPSNYDAVNIALYHGAINKSKTDSNWTLGGDHSVEIFEEFDFAFLGDIHKTQQLDTEGRIWYAGSTIQQNFGESLDKGYLLWDIEDKDKFSNRLITFKNPKPFITITLTEKGNLPRVAPPHGARLRIVTENNVSLDKVRKAVDVVKFKYNPESVTYLNRAAGKQIKVAAPEGLKKQDLRDLKTQETLIAKYLKEYEATEEVLERVYELNKEFNKQIEENEDVMRNINWSLQKLEWDNLFNYAEGNSIDFTKLEGIVGIFGKNYSGKSSIVDTLLYSMYNSTSKSIRKNLNIINQNKDLCMAKATIKVDGKNYIIERKSNKYTKRLKGVETQEATTDLEFYSKDSIGNYTGLNGTSRQDTDKNVRKYFGTLQDFLATSMASQLDSLSFINEGSTKRKEFLAKFLDLEIFDKKFKMAKEASADIKISLKRLEGIDFETNIETIKSEITKGELAIEKNRAICASLKQDLSQLTDEVRILQGKINSVPAEIIDPVMTASKITQKEKTILEINAKKTEAQKDLGESKIKYEKIELFLNDFEIEKYKQKKESFAKVQEELSRLDVLLAALSEQKKMLVAEQEKVCASCVPLVGETIKQKTCEISFLSQKADEIRSTHSLEEQKKINDYISNYNSLIEKRNNLANLITTNNLIIERADSLLFKEQVGLDELREKATEYEDNKEAIENLKQLIADKQSLTQQVKIKESELSTCDQKIMQLHKKHGSSEQKLLYIRQQQKEFQQLEQDFAAYHLFMVCCHPNGVSYEIIKERLPYINQEISKILTNIVDFEVFISNNEDKLDIFIKHPSHDPRPLEMGSGAEKTIASMAIRLAFLTVSSLPKSDLFILDEPGTALDEDNMEGFVRILDMIKGYFKTVVLISHLDSLKDCVDMQINIEKLDGFAHVNI